MRLPRQRQEAEALRAVAVHLRDLSRRYRLPTDDGLLLTTGTWADEEIRKGCRAAPGYRAGAIDNWGAIGDGAWLVSFNAWTLLRPPWELKPFALKMVDRVRPSVEARKRALVAADLLEAAPGKLPELDISALPSAWSRRWIRDDQREARLAITDLDRLDEIAAAAFLALEPP